MRASRAAALVACAAAAAAAAGSPRRGAVQAQALAWAQPLKLILSPEDVIELHTELADQVGSAPADGVVFALAPVSGSSADAAGLLLNVSVADKVAEAEAPQDLVVHFGHEALPATRPLKFTVTAGRRPGASPPNSEAYLTALVTGSRQQFVTVSPGAHYAAHWWADASAGFTPYRFNMTVTGAQARTSYRLTLRPGTWDGQQSVPAKGTVYVGTDDQVGPNPEDHEASGTDTVTFEGTTGTTLWFLAAADTGGNPAPSAACAWQLPSSENFHYQCKDGHFCVDGDQQGACCGAHQGIARCPSDRPLMCADENGCAGHTDFCCAADAAGCAPHGGPRACPGSFSFDIQVTGGGGPPAPPPTPGTPSTPAPTAAGGGGGGDGISGGGIFLILVFCGFAAYAGVGALLKMKEGHRGCPDVMPHAGFWQELPALVSDGWNFAHRSVMGWVCGRATGSGGQRRYQPVARDDFGDEDQTGFGGVGAGDGYGTGEQNRPYVPQGGGLNAAPESDRCQDTL
eukprot:TRINITY_DN13053_c0_g2_i1.p1 TRINITY_DN13053_c0_g2~~TRINITY_DN13053_c0_g2_i1.p1  ORF type:complete len:514 (+),score=122.56 TRINITY_DN13053_c0_g2_i1:81-1622(+)